MTAEHERYTVPQMVLDETHAFLYRRGLLGCEGMALWIGQPGPHHTVFTITRALIPDQLCIKTKQGVAVMLTEEAHYTLTDHLRSGERFYVRVHSHPGEAYHSPQDDENAVLTHEGALSIVVPDFAVRPISLTSCAVYRLLYGQGWVHVSAAKVAALFEVVP